MAMARGVHSGLQRGGRVDVRLGGFGGQGIILAGYILGRAATVHGGHDAVMSQSYGPESRGGACLAEVIIADEEITYPRIVTPDVVVMMSLEAYRKYAPDRPEHSLLIVDEDLVTIDEELERGRQVLKAPATRLAEELGRRIIANIVMLGFICGATNVADVESIREAVAASVPAGTEELNLRAVDAGYDYAMRVLGAMEGGEAG